MTAADPAVPALTLYVRAGCRLCDQFLLDLTLDLGELGRGLAVVDVDTSEALAIEYGLRVPVLVAAGAVICEAAYERDRVRTALRL